MTHDNQNDPAPETAPPSLASSRGPTDAAESQKQRWLKYGSNVVLMSLIVIALAGLVIYLAQYRDKRIDMTSMHAYGLKPQSVSLLHATTQPIKIVSLYQLPENAADDSNEQRKAKIAQRERAQMVSDLLDEYKRDSQKVEVESIDPVTQLGRVDSLITDVISKYGKEVTQYKSAIDAFYKTLAQIKALADPQVAKVKALPMDKLQNNPELRDTLELALSTVETFPPYLEKLKGQVENITKQKLPNYRSAVDAIATGMVFLSSQSGKVADDFAQAKSDIKVPQEFRTYVTEAQPQFDQIRKLADTLNDQINKLGTLKLEDLRQSLRAKDTILVMGEKDMRVLPYDQVWQTDKDIRNNLQSNTAIKPRFAGEQQITTAILGLNQATKPKVCFVRPSGPPLASSNPFMRNGPFSRVADRLRDYNFDVLEKDLSGQFAMQAQMQGMPADKEPSDDEIKDAVWVVVAFPNQPQGPMPTPNADVAGKLAQHLSNGGSAMLLLFPQGENFDSVLKPWGIEANTNVIAVHEKIPLTDTADEMERVKQVPFVFLFRDYGNHPIAKPLQSLDALIAPMLSIKTHETKGVTVTPLLPTPPLLKCWGETDINALETDRSAKFDPDKGDIPGPLNGAAASEKVGSGARLVAFGAPQFAFNTIVAEPDPAMLQRGLLVSRFPGNAELFVNSVFWLSHMDTMLAISPSAMDAPRIASMSPPELRFWRVGVLVLGLPGLALITGIGVYFARRD